MIIVEGEDGVDKVKELLNKFNHPYAEVIAKIESRQGIDNLEEILKVSDGIMVARGDLGVEVAPELVPMYQKKHLILSLWMIIMKQL